MANEEHLAILRQGVEVWNAWRKEHLDVQPDLRGANLMFAYLGEADLSEADLIGARLQGVRLRGADLRGAEIRGAEIREANLTRANLTRADLTGADLTGADLTMAHLRETSLSETSLTWANLTGADLTRADLTRALLSGTLLTILDLSTVIGLDTVRHLGSSAVDTNTLYLSQGKIPEAFLSGCGIPDTLIEYLPSLIGAMEPIQFYSCFISYSTKDEEFAKRLHSKMRDNNLRVWFANEELKGGHKLHEQIEDAIRVYDKFIIVLSPESLRSKWVMSEVRRTRKAELANNQRKFFPIALLPYRELEGWECIDPETGTDLAAEIREYYIPDFRGWKNHDKFEKAFAQLLEGLKAVDAPPAPRAPVEVPKIPNPNESKQRRLKILEDQQAKMGTLTPPYVTMEIEDLRKELGEPRQDGI